MNAMRNLAGLALPVALAACAQGADDQQAAEAEPAVEAAPASAVYGAYAVAMADGSERRQTLLLDGSYSDTGPDGEVIERGTWREDGMALCFDPEGEPGETCYTAANPGADGSFDKLDPEGNVYARLRRIEETSALLPHGRFAGLLPARKL